MYFPRSIPPRTYQDYTAYRPLLRADFHYRCAYCLTHEYFLGGEAGCEIDHHHPIHGPNGRPDLIATYTNFYWSCRECNQNKGDTWPSPEEWERGVRFLDPCQPEDDHDLHWRFLPDGRLEALTPVGAYTEERLLLWRPLLRHRRAQHHRWQQEADQLTALLADKKVPVNSVLPSKCALQSCNSGSNHPFFIVPMPTFPHLLKRSRAFWVSGGYSPRSLPL